MITAVVALVLAPGEYTVTASKEMRIVPGAVMVHGAALRQNFAIDTGNR